MTNVKKIIKYVCSSCGHVYNDAEEAENCCPNSADEIEMFKCGDCDNEFDTEIEAEECCKDIDEV